MIYSSEKGIPKIKIKEIDYINFKIKFNKIN